MVQPTLHADSELVVARDADVTELRLALVCFGGVSLAIYMHGLTKEIQSLLTASRAFDRALAVMPDNGKPQPDDLPEAGTERAYFEVLTAMWRAGAPVSASVDIVSGTSAGGINGVCLAQAAVCGGSQDKLTQLWMEKGDIKGLLRLGFLGQHLGEAATALLLPWKLHSDWSPLKGDDMSRWLIEALRAIEDEADPARTLVPEGGTVDLFVTTTDLHGTDRVLSLGSGGGLHEQTYHRVLNFSHRPGADGSNTLGKGFAWPLAYSARATSCFPGAFPPVSPAEFEEAVGRHDNETFDAKRFASVFMPDLDGSNGDPSNVFMMDGGVLDNEPFDHTIHAIARRPAGREVVRHLVYIEPSPGQASPGTTIGELKKSGEGKDAEAPDWIAGVWAAMSTIPRHQPLIGAVEELAEVNEAVASIGRIVDALATDVDAALDEIADLGTLTELGFDAITAKADAVYAAVPSTVGPLNYRTYLRLKCQATAEDLATVIADHLAYPAGSGRRDFLTRGLRAWLQARGEWTTADEIKLSEYLGPLDVPYRVRRLKFIIDGINHMFAQASKARVKGETQEDVATRAQLATAKRAAWTLVLAEQAKPATAMAQLGADVLAFASPEHLSPDVLIVDPARWAAQNAHEINAFVTAYLPEIKKLTDRSTPDLFAAFQANTGDWTSASARRDLVGRFVGFPIWDALLFPSQALSHLPLTTPVHATRFSPLDASRLQPPPEQNSGKLLGTSTHHFGGFFALDRRQNDYLWGRLDGAELLIKLLNDHYRSVAGNGGVSDAEGSDGDLPGRASMLDSALARALDQEAGSLDEISGTIKLLRDQLPG